MFQLQVNVRKAYFYVETLVLSIIYYILGRNADAYMQFATIL